jgi:hypothetical protein
MIIKTHLKPMSVRVSTRNMCHPQGLHQAVFCKGIGLWSIMWLVVKTSI